MKLIDADALIEKCGEWYVEEGSEEGFIGTIKQLIDAQLTIKPEHMHTVMLKIAEKYEKAMNTSYILNPMAWALYQTWKEYDR